MVVRSRSELVNHNHHQNKNNMKRTIQLTLRNMKTVGLTLFAYLITFTLALAQDGNAGINEATMRVRSYFTTGTNLMYAIGAVLGLVGAVKVYQKWNSGDPDTGKVAAAWFGSCVFLVIVATVLQSFFGL